MRIKSLITLVLALTVVLCSDAISQELKDMKVVEVPEGSETTYIVRNPREAILIAHSPIVNMAFENNMGIIKVDNPNPGEFRIHIPPGTNIVTFKADGYLPLKKRFNIKAKSYKEVRVIPQRLSLSHNRPEIRLQYTLESPDERVLGSIDNNVLNLNFINGEVILKPAPGTHSVRLNSKGRIWEKTFILEEGQKALEVVMFSDEKVKDYVPDEPGSLFLTTIPPGATVYMNELEQGKTPLTLEHVEPGKYEIDLVRPLYLLEHFVLDINPLDYNTHSVILTPNFGVVEIESNPQGASVIVDGAEKGRTPLIIPQIDAGNHIVKLIRSRFHDEEDILKIEPGDTLLKNYQLRPKFGNLEITSDPPGAVVRIDGEIRGETPVKIDTIGSGSHIISLKLKNYNELVDQIEISDRSVVSKNYDLKGDFGLFTLITEPSGAQVIFQSDNVENKVSPVEELKLKPGTYFLNIMKTGYEPLETSVMIALGKKESIDLTLERSIGTLKISSRPQLATIYLDDVEVGQTPKVFREIPIGDHIVRLEKDGFDVFEERITIERRQIRNINHELSTVGFKRWQAKRYEARALASYAPGVGQFHSGQWVRGLVYSLLFLGTVGSAFDNRMEYDNLNDSYLEAEKSYQSTDITSEMQAHFTDMEDLRGKMVSKNDRINNLMFASVAIYIIQSVDAWIWGGGKQPKAPRQKLIGKKFGMAPGIIINPNKVAVGICLTLGGKK